MPKFSEQLVERCRIFFAQKYGTEITSDEAEVFLSHLADYFELGVARAERSENARRSPRRYT